MSADDLLEAIRQREHTQRSLFDLAVRQLGMSYNQAHDALRRLEQRGQVRVIRKGAGSPLVIQVVDDER